MGRTVPSTRMAVESEVDRIRKLMDYIHDRELKRAFEEIIDSYADIAPVFRAVPPYDKAYAIVLAGLARALKRIDEIERKVDSGR
ncbi:MAG: hypothetical protein JHC28_03705 [Thermoprotei archaeon]|uniref:Uncharacterized protein n=1 Tax=Fervidicoccus fontis TaxID=683846 RepID=A0A7J3SLU4_9CREN|nr:hypothetical protein [Thermoprotei archaeon]